MHGIGILWILIMTSGAYETVNGHSLHRICEAVNSDIEWMPKKSCTPLNCLRIVIIHILYAPSWHIWTTDNDFWG
jgi:hypothetical protein